MIAVNGSQLPLAQVSLTLLQPPIYGKQSPIAQHNTQLSKMPGSDQVTPQGLLDRAISLQPCLHERRARTRELRRVPYESITDQKQAGLFEIMQQARFGGYEMNPEHFCDAVFEAACASH